jgi:hypothetical protein
MNNVYSSTEVKKLLNITGYELHKMRESEKIPFEKVKGRYKYTLDEELTKSFLLEPINNNSLSTTSDADHVEKKFSDELELPDYNSYGYSAESKKQLQISKIQERDTLIELYRTIADKPEVESAIDEIVNEMTSIFKTGDLVKIDFLEDSKVGDKTKKSIKKAFDKSLRLLDFYGEGDEIVKDWYRDGFLPFEIIYDNKKVKNGINNIIQLSPFKFKKIKIINENKYIYTYQDVQDLEIQTNAGLDKNIPIYKEEQIVLGTSGKLDPTKTYSSSYLRPALKAINDLTHIENSIVINRLTKASDKNIWNIDIGSMSNVKGKQHLASVAQDVQTNVKYNTETGLTSTDVAVGIQSDWIFPTRNGKQKTSVETIDGNADFISKLDDLWYFRKKVNEALKIPVGRLDQESTMEFSTEDILREELKFTLFVNKLRKRFSRSVFIPIIYRELISTQEITENEWKEVEQSIIFLWNESNAIVAKAEANNAKSKLESVADVEDSGLIGKYISMEYVYKNILQMSKDEFDEQKKIIEEEKAQGLHKSEDEEV